MFLLIIIKFIKEIVKLKRTKVMAVAMACGVIGAGLFPVTSALANSVNAQVTYTPDGKISPGDDGSYSLEIPANYIISDDALKTPVTGEVVALEGNGTFGEYKGNSTIKVDISSANNFQFKCGEKTDGQYQLQDGSGNALSSLELNKNKTKESANVKLLKRATTKGVFSDTLTFTHSIKK